MVTFVLRKNGLSKKDEEKIYKYFFKNFKDKTLDEIKSNKRKKNSDIVASFFKEFYYFDNMKGLLEHSLVYPFNYSEEEGKKYLKLFLAFNICFAKIWYYLDREPLDEVEYKDWNAIVDFENGRFGNSKELFQELKKQIVKKINGLERELNIAKLTRIEEDPSSIKYRKELFSDEVEFEMKRKALSALVKFIELGIKYPNLILKMYY